MLLNLFRFLLVLMHSPLKTSGLLWFSFVLFGAYSFASSDVCHSLFGFRRERQALRRAVARLRRSKRAYPARRGQSLLFSSRPR